MPEILNSLRELMPTFQWVTGTVAQVTGTTVALQNLSGNVDTDQTQPSITRNSIGNYTLTIQNFKPLTGAGVALALASVTTTGLAASVTPQIGTYSGDAASFVFVVTSIGAGQAALDNTFTFLALAY